MRTKIQFGQQLLVLTSQHAVGVANMYILCAVLPSVLLADMFIKCHSTNLTFQVTVVHQFFSTDQNILRCCHVVIFDFYERWTS